MPSVRPAGSDSRQRRECTAGTFFGISYAGAGAAAAGGASAARVTLLTAPSTAQLSNVAKTCLETMFIWPLPFEERLL